MVIAPEQLQQNLTQLSADELRQAVTDLLRIVAANEGVLQQQAQALAFKQATIDKLTFENAYLKRLKFAAQSERYNAEQRSLLEETLDADMSPTPPPAPVAANCAVSVKTWPRSWTTCPVS